MNLTENSSKLKPFVITNRFLLYFLKSSLVQDQFKNAIYGMALPKLALKRIAIVFLPLPPLAEQTEIVRKVESLLAKVSELENQIAERQEQTKQLVQVILKDAFEEK